MSHRDGIIYVDTETGAGIWINSDALTADIQAVLTTSLADIGSIITTTAINKWAKFKPIKVHGLDFPRQRNSDFTWKTAAQITALGEVPWWIGTNGQCGLTFTTFENLYTGNNPFADGSFLKKLITSPWPIELAWGYERPTGGANQYPYRFFDFLYYSHYAPKPVSGVYDNLRLYGGGKLTVQLDLTRAQEDLGIQFDDLTIGQTPVSGFYFGVLIYMSSSVGNYAFAFSGETIGNGGTYVQFTNMNTFGGRDVTIVPFLSSVTANQNTSPGSGVFLSCDVEPQSVTIGAEVPAVSMSIDAQWRFSLPGPVHYDIRIINNSGATVSVSNMVIALYDGDPDNGGVRVEYKPTIATFNISNGDFHDEIGTFQNEHYDSTKTYYVVVSSDRPEVNGKKEVEAPRNS